MPAAAPVNLSNNTTTNTPSLISSLNTNSSSNHQQYHQYHHHRTISSSSSSSPSNMDEITTLFVIGFPDNTTEREFKNMFTFCQGFETAILKLPPPPTTTTTTTMDSNGTLTATSDDQLSNMAPYATDKRQTIGFVKFRSRNDALFAREVLCGKRIDESKSTVLKAEIAKKNLHVPSIKSSAYSGTTTLASFRRSNTNTPSTSSSNTTTATTSNNNNSTSADVSSSSLLATCGPTTIGTASPSDAFILSSPQLPRDLLNPPDYPGFTDDPPSRGSSVSDGSSGGPCTEESVTEDHQNSTSRSLLTKPYESSVFGNLLFQQQQHQQQGTAHHHQNHHQLQQHQQQHQQLKPSAPSHEPALLSRFEPENPASNLEKLTISTSNIISGSNVGPYSAGGGLNSAYSDGGKYSPLPSMSATTPGVEKKDLLLHPGNSTNSNAHFHRDYHHHRQYSEPESLLHNTAAAYIDGSAVNLPGKNNMNNNLIHHQMHQSPQQQQKQQQQQQYQLSNASLQGYQNGHSQQQPQTQNHHSQLSRSNTINIGNGYHMSSAAEKDIINAIPTRSNSISAPSYADHHKHGASFHHQHHQQQQQQSSQQQRQLHQQQQHSDFLLGNSASQHAANTPVTTSSSSSSSQHPQNTYHNSVVHSQLERSRTPTAGSPAAVLTPPITPTNYSLYVNNQEQYHQHFQKVQQALQAKHATHSNYNGVQARDQNPPCNTLYVGNLPSSTNPEELEELFSRCRGYKRLCFRMRSNGPMCFVEFEDVLCASIAMQDLYGTSLSTHTKGGGIRLSFSKNPLGVRLNHHNQVQVQTVVGGGSTSSATANSSSAASSGSNNNNMSAVSSGRGGGSGYY